MNFSEAVKEAVAALEQLSEVPCQAEIMAAYALDALRRKNVESVNAMVDLSETQGLSWDATKLVAIDLLARKEELPPALSDWLIRYLSDELTQPKRPKRWSRGWPGEHEERDILIHDVVRSLVQKGVRDATRNDVSSATSACDAVAKAMVQLRLVPSSYKEIKRIYLARKKDLREERNLLSSVAVMSEVIKDTR